MCPRLSSSNTVSSPSATIAEGHGALLIVPDCDAGYENTNLTAHNLDGNLTPETQARLGDVHCPVRVR